MMFIIQEEKKAAHPMMIMMVTWVCVMMWGFPCTSLSVISSAVTYARVATVSLNRMTIRVERFKINADTYPKFDARLMRK